MLGIKTGFIEIDELIGQSRFITNLKNILLSLSANRSCVLISGEKGTGKSLFAKHLHLLSNSDSSGFIKINCRYFINESSEDVKVLSFLDECTNRADRITLYFDGIGYLNKTFQEALYNFIKRTVSERKNVRFIFSTQENLDKLVNENRFQKELYMIISTVLVNMMPLFQREDDVLLLAEYFYRKNNALSGNVFADLPFNEKLQLRIKTFYWKGNIAELKNCMEHAFLVAEPPYIGLQDLNFSENMNSGVEKSSTYLENLSFEECNEQNEKFTLKNVMDELKKEYVTKVLQQTSWNQTKAAKILGIQRTYVIKLMNELDIHKQM